MIFRLRQCGVAPRKTDVFNDFFLERLLPIQKRYGANLIGRQQTEDGKGIAALWVYYSIEQYESIQAKVSVDPDSIQVQKFWRTELNPLFTETGEAFMVSTIPLDWTELSHLSK